MAALARALADPTRVRLIEELAGGEATVSELGCRLGLEVSRVSTHLAILRQTGLVRAQVQGRQHRYALAGERPAVAVAALRTLAAVPPKQRLSLESPLRRARTCYDHLAGHAGVHLLDGLLERGWLRASGERDLELTAAGAAALPRLCDLEAARRARRRLALRCQDWTECRPHLGGALGAALLLALLQRGAARLRPGERALDLEPGQPEAFLAAADD